MKKERLDLLPILLEKYKNKIKIDVEKGTIEGLCIYENHKGYKTVNFWHKNKSKYYRVHEIIAYLGGLDLDGLTVNHINEDKNDNRLANLETLTAKENHNAFNFRKTHEKLTEEDICDILYEYKGKRGDLSRLGRKFNVDPWTIKRYVEKYSKEEL